MTVETVVVIPCKNEAARLPRQLQALNAQTDLDFSVVISDNGSTDATALIAENWGTHFAGGVRVVDSSERAGVAYARNAAIAGTTEPFILICDGDDRVHPNWVAGMRAALKEHDIVTGPLHVKFPTEPKLDTVWNAEHVPISMGYLPYAPGGNVGMKREVFEALEGFDASMRLGQEDVDFGWRASRAGFSIGHSPDAALDYFQRSDWKGLLKQQCRYGQAHVALYNKHRTVPMAPPPASYTASLRWFWEWAKQLPRNLAEGKVRNVIGALVFQLSRFWHSLRMGKSPL